MAGNDSESRGGPPLAAIGSVLFAAVIGVAAWYWFGKAADKGVERLARLDTMRVLCEGFYAQARDRMDSMRVDRAPLPDTIDAGSKDAFDRCGDLRGQSVPNELPNARELNGQEMPRGLR